MNSEFTLTYPKEEDGDKNVSLFMALVKFDSNMKWN